MSEPSGIRWAKYYTPTDIGSRLVTWMGDDWLPKNSVDICAGECNLLAAVHARWPDIHLTANDITDVGEPRYNWNRFSRCVGDGRAFALEKVDAGDRYDLVVANPPFGKAEILDEGILYGDRWDDETRRLLRSRRLEVSMLTASALLVSSTGALGAIVPETIAYGQTSRPLRQWLSHSFSEVRFQRKRPVGGRVPAASLAS